MALQPFGQFLNQILLVNLVERNERYALKLERRKLRDASDPFQLEEHAFRQQFRLSRRLVRNLVETLRPHLPVAQRSTCIPLELKILSTLNFLATGSYQRSVGTSFLLGLSQPSFSQCLNEVTSAIVAHLLDIWVVFPQTEISRNIIKRGFQEKYGFPGIIGAIDCTHIAIVAPPEDDPVHPALPYYNRKGYYSINAQMICDADMKILNCNARFPGSTHDSAIWSLCAVKRHLVEKFVQEELNECWLIGDSGYGLQPWLLTPIEHADPNSPEGRYTRCQILARNTIERCFGILKQKFRCLLKHRTLHYDPVKAGKIIYTCAVLHNMSIFEEVPEVPEVIEEERIEGADQDIDPNQPWLAQGRMVQRHIIRNYFT